MKTTLKFIFFCIFLNALSLNLFSQNDIPPPPPEVESQPLVIVEQMPTFVGGQDLMIQFIKKNLSYPKEAIDKNISGTCYINFIVEPDGSITNIKVLRGVKDGQMLDDEALRVVKLMPNWEPGKQDGKYVRVQFVLPIKFTLPKTPQIIDIQTTPDQK